MIRPGEASLVAWAICSCLFFAMGVGVATCWRWAARQLTRGCV